MPIDDLPAWLGPWCSDQLGVGMRQVFFRRSQMSLVLGLRLVDGRAVAVKARPDENGRADSCVAAQGQLAARGRPCAAPLTPVVTVQGLSMHAEQWCPGGSVLRSDTPACARRVARLFAMLMQELTRVKVPPPLPNPHWLRWEHPDAGVWPAMAFLDCRDQTLIPEFVTRTAHLAAQRLRRSDLPNVLGHGDFEAQNIRWQGEAPLVMHDWDSLSWLPEAALTGAAAGAFASTEVPTLAPIHSSAAFLQEYQSTRRRSFTAEEIEVAWAASLWPAAHNARAQALHGQQPIAGEALRTQAPERLALAGA
ncbi:MAG: phosphotransferase [Nakamurella sp.]